MTIKASNPTEAKAFLDFLYTPAAQKIFADNGYRPVVKGVVPADTFPTPADLFTIDDLGGWTDVTKEFFDADNGIVTAIETVERGRRRPS